MILCDYNTHYVLPLAGESEPKQFVRFSSTITIPSVTRQSNESPEKFQTNALTATPLPYSGSSSQSNVGVLRQLKNLFYIFSTVKTTLILIHELEGRVSNTLVHPVWKTGKIFNNKPSSDGQMSNYNSRNLNLIASLKRFTPNIIITDSSYWNHCAKSYKQPKLKVV